MAQILYPVFAEASVFTASPTLNPSSVPKKNVAVETFPVVGLAVGMKLIVEAPALEAGLFLIGARASAVDTLELTFWNTTSGNIDPAAQTFDIKAF